MRRLHELSGKPSGKATEPDRYFPPRQSVSHRASGFFPGRASSMPARRVFPLPPRTQDRSRRWPPASRPPPPRNWVPADLARTADRAARSRTVFPAGVARPGVGPVRPGRCARAAGRGDPAGRGLHERWRSTNTTSAARARQRPMPSRAAAGEQIQAAGAGQDRGQPVEQGFRTRSGVGRRPGRSGKINRRPRHCPPMTRNWLAWPPRWLGERAGSGGVGDGALAGPGEVGAF